MHRALAIGFLGLSFIIFGMVRADAAAPGDTKVGYVDLKKTLQETQVGRKARQRLEGDKRKKQQELDKRQKQLQQFAAELDKQRVVLKPKVLRQREQELQQKYVELQKRYAKLQQDLAKKEAKLVNRIFNKAAPIIKDIASRDGYTMILEKNQSAVLWASGALDITAEVNSRLQ